MPRMGEPMPEQTVSPVAPFTTTFVFPWEKAPLSLNYRMHRMVAAKITKDLRGMMHAKARHIPTWASVGSSWCGG